MEVGVLCMLWMEHCHHEQEYLNTEGGSGGGGVVLWVEHCHHEQEYLNTEGGSGGGGVVHAVGETLSS